MSTPLPYITTGGTDDPLLPHLANGIRRSDHIDIAVAFVQFSGLRVLREDLIEALERKAQVRILTGDYLDITDPRALDEIMGLIEMYEGMGARVFQCQGKISFHPKVYLFRRQSDGGEDGEIFIGSSNISGSALTVGIEWNLRVVKEENEERFHEIHQRFDELYLSADTTPLTREWVMQYRERRTPPQVFTDEIEARSPSPEPFPIQAEALDALVDSRKRGDWRGLVVLATGLGKTWLAGFDVLKANAKRVLFVAHREEILHQAMNTFLKIVPQASCGLFMGSRRDVESDFLFASVQSIGRHSHLSTFPPDQFDHIIIDEFHHASATMYQRVLHHFRPKYLLGLTATPDRSDGKDILALCDGNLVYECPLAKGIERQYLAPFHYFGITDTEVDYTAIPWRNGRFNEGELERMVATERRAEHSLQEWKEKGGQKTLAFCVSRRHADFMAEYFSGMGIPAVSVHSTSEVRRKEAMDGLSSGEHQVVFSVDLFNEGFDLPGIDTIMMLRPTESSILFLQQLGRGLRKSPGKDHLTVLDFIGNHRSFLNRPRLLLSLEDHVGQLILSLKQIKEGVVPAGLPAGCMINYDLRAIDFFEECLTQSGERSRILYLHFKDTYGRRPTARELFRMGAPMTTIRNGFGGWFQFVLHMGDLDDGEEDILGQLTTFLVDLEKSNMNKCFKMVLLEALLDNGGLVRPLNERELAMHSWDKFEKNPEWKSDIQKSLRSKDDWKSDGDWVDYWKRNPIKAFLGGSYFNLDQDKRFVFTHPLPEEGLDLLESMLREIIDLRMSQYWQRKVQSKEAPATIVCPVIQSNGRPIIKLNQRHHLPNGKFPIEAEGVHYTGKFVKYFLNVIRDAQGNNVLPGMMRSWFGPTAGAPGQSHHIEFFHSNDTLVMKAVGERYSESSHQSRIIDETLPEERFVSYLPFYPIDIVAGEIEDSGKLPEPETWFHMEGLSHKKLTEDLFVATITGDSMEPNIPNGSSCLFSRSIAGSKSGEIILVNLPSYIVPEATGSCLIKRYRSEKGADEEGNILHSRVILESLNPKYTPIVLESEQLEHLRILARFVQVLPTDRA